MPTGHPLIHVGLCVLSLGLISSAAQGEAPASASAPSSELFKGWVRVHGRKLPTTVPAWPGDDHETASEGNEEAPELYINKVEGGQCMIVNLPGEKRVRYFCVKRGEMMEYNGRHKSLAIGVLHPQEARRITEEVGKYPLTVEEIIKALKDSGAEILDQTEEKEGQRVRVEIVYMGGSICAAADQPGGRDVIWVDPKTHLVQRIESCLGAPQEVTYTYLKGIKDIYDMGVPRDAKIIDSRPDAQTKAVLDRLGERYQEDYGNYVAVLTETDHRKSWGSKKMFLHFYGREGSRALYAQYGFSENEYPDSPMLGIQQWPQPQVDQVLALAGKSIPVCSYATDGRKVSLGTFDAKSTETGRFREHEGTAKEYPFLPDYRLANHVWKCRDSLFMWGFCPRPDLVTDEKRPDAIGLRIREGDFSAQSTDERRQERVFWLDPKRDDVPLEMTTHYEKFGPDRKATVIDFQIRFDQYAQLPNGQWCPVHWENQATRTEVDGTKDGYTREFHLQMFPGMKLDKAWYGSRAKALGVPQAIQTLKEEQP